MHVINLVRKIDINNKQEVDNAPKVMSMKKSPEPGDIVTEILLVDVIEELTHLYYTIYNYIYEN